MDGQLWCRLSRLLVDNVVRVSLGSSLDGSSQAVPRELRAPLGILSMPPRSIPLSRPRRWVILTDASATPRPDGSLLLGIGGALFDFSSGQ
eukprot:5012176-Amphidinium_carterae.1